jgi:hypothetical protein
MVLIPKIMTNWITENFGIKNFLILAAVLLIITCFIFGPSTYKLMQEHRYKGEMKARITNIVIKKAAYQHLNGTNEKVVGYDVTYDFTVNGKNYVKTENMPPDSEIKALSDKFNSGQACFVVIKYSPGNPEESVIAKLLPVAG